MPWLQVRLAISPEQAETYEDAFLEVGAVSVTFMDAEDQPIFEPELNTTPLWSHTHLLALFEERVFVGFGLFWADGETDLQPRHGGHL